MRNPKLAHILVSKSKPKSDKVATNKTKQTNKQQTTIFLPKINKAFLRPILQNLKGWSVLDNFFENDHLDEPKQMPPSKTFYLFSKTVKNAKW